MLHKEFKTRTVGELVTFSDFWSIYPILILLGYDIPIKFIERYHINKSKFYWISQKFCEKILLQTDF